MRCHFSSGNLALPGFSLSRIGGSAFPGRVGANPAFLDRDEISDHPPKVALCLSEIWRGPIRDSGRMTATLPLSDWGRVADQTSRNLGANVMPRPERRAGSQTHKSRRGLGESRYRGTLGDPGASLGQRC